jgi:hypothetical protein
MRQSMLGCAAVLGNVPRQNAKMPRVAGRLLHPKFLLLSFTPICHASNMSAKQVLQGAQNVVIRGGTFMAADTVSEAL